METRNNLLFEKPYRVHSFETDTSGRLSTEGLFNYLQDIASDHASLLHLGKDDLGRNKMFWALSRIYCKISSLPGWNDEILIRTWPEGTNGAFAIRHFEILNNKTERIADASSCWIIVNSENRRPVRPDNIFLDLPDGLQEKKAKVRLPEKIKPLTNETYRSPLTKVRYSDLDINMHVNNVKYIQWVLDTYPLEYRLKNRVRSLEINYLSEALPDENIYICSTEDNGFFLHTTIKEAGEKPSSVVRIGWDAC